MLNLFRLYWRFDRLWFILMILFFLVFATFMMGFTWKNLSETNVWGVIQGAPNQESLSNSTMQLFNWIFIFPLIMWIGNCLNVFDIYRIQKQNWLLPVSLKEKYSSRIVFNLCLTVVFILVTTLIVDWVRVPLAHFLSIDKPIEKGWALPLLAWFFNWPTVIFYLWLFTGCYYLSARFKKIGFLVIVPFGLNALYVFAVLLDFSEYLDWMPYLAILLAVGTVFNIRLGYRQFQKLEVVLQFTPKEL